MFGDGTNFEGMIVISNGWFCCHSEGGRQAEEIGREELQAQQRQMKSPAPGEEKPSVPG